MLDVQILGLTMGKESDMGEKIFLLIIDKIILGIIAVLIVMHFQNKSQETAKLMDRVSSVTRIYSDILIEQRTNLAKETYKYHSGLDRIKQKGKVGTEDCRCLTECVDAVMLVSLIVSDVDENLGKAIATLSQNMRDLLTRISTDKYARANIDQSRKHINNCYTSAMKSFRDALRHVVEEEHKWVIEDSIVHCTDDLLSIWVP